MTVAYNGSQDSHNTAYERTVVQQQHAVQARKELVLGLVDGEEHGHVPGRGDFG